MYSRGTTRLNVLQHRHYPRQCRPAAAVLRSDYQHEQDLHRLVPALDRSDRAVSGFPVQL